MKLPNNNEVRKPTRTISGVAPIAVMAEPRQCAHGICRYCPKLDVPQSYTPLSPPVIRAKMLKYSPYEQVISRLKAYRLMNHSTDKIELIIMGGTFASYPLEYQENFIKECYDALNECSSSNIEEAKKMNEKAKHRCVALCIETRPDFASREDILRFLKFGATRIELGVQAIDDSIYRLINRGHTVRDVIESTERLKNSGFKVGYHFMPGLPGSNPKKDLQMFQELFNSEKFKPDQIKIYPCQVIRGSQLEKDYLEGRFSPYSQEQIYNLLIKMMKTVPRYCRVMRIMRELAPEYIVAGTTRISLRKDIEEELRKSKTKIREIRFREVGFSNNKNLISIDNLKIKTTKYRASKGTEYFIEVVDNNDVLFGLLRLRINDDLENNFITELNNSSIIRELHVYGRSSSIGSLSSFGGIPNIQHKGLGKKLINKAEQIVYRESKKNAKIKRIAIISGVGVREYYRELGYHLEGNYMIKQLN
ncbi:MAG: tRNA uridine(34) 5-carboxymethylaminomethyl modification radical SAM/GNAT enzyme Elp3 [Candidatus Pacearchaeota archaeon]